MPRNPASRAEMAAAQPLGELSHSDGPIFVWRVGNVRRTDAALDVFRRRNFRWFVFASSEAAEVIRSGWYSSVQSWEGLRWCGIKSYANVLEPFPAPDNPLFFHGPPATTDQQIPVGTLIFESPAFVIGAWQEIEAWLRENYPDPQG